MKCKCRAQMKLICDRKVEGFEITTHNYNHIYWCPNCGRVRELNESGSLSMGMWYEPKKVLKKPLKKIKKNYQCPGSSIVYVERELDGMYRGG